MPATFAKAETDPLATGQVSAEQTARIAADLLKQDAATAATDAELNALFGGAPTWQLVPSGFPTSAPAASAARQNTTGKTLLVKANVGVLSDPGENGHLYMDISPNNVDWTSYAAVAYVANRNTAQNIGQTGVGGHVFALVPNGWWYRYSSITIAGYSNPDYVLNNGFELLRTVT